MKTKLRRFLQGKTKAGQTVYGIIDALPVFNPLNIARAVLNDTPNPTAREFARGFASKIDPIRLVVSVAVTYFIVTGKLTAQTAGELIELIMTILS
jgi:hypothetical protein